MSARRTVFACVAACAGLLSGLAQADMVIGPQQPPDRFPPLLRLEAPRAAEAPELASPDGRLRLRLLTDGEGRVGYEVVRDQRPALRPSLLGLELDGARWVDGLTLGGCRAGSGRERYALIGKQREVDHRWNGQTCTLRNARGQVLRLELRAFDDGVALRYVAADREPARKRFVQELTQWNVNPDTRSFLQPMQRWKTGWKGTNPAYEEHYAIDAPLGQQSAYGEGWVFPALLRSGDTWIAITEAGLDGRFHASRLWAGGGAEGGGYRIGWPLEGETGGGDQRLAEVNGTLATPWRVVAIGDLRTLMQSTLGTDLAAPAIPFPKDKLRPGPASWSWALLKDDGTVFDVQKRFIDHAAAMGWPYTLVDADWDRKIGWDRIRELVSYAKRKNVRLWLWYNSSGPWNDTEYTPKGALIDPAKRRAEFRKLADAGIAGLKIDFFGGDGQSVIRYYVDLMEDAAKAGLLLNFHGATLPRGWNRTWPNLMTAEAVKGFEFATFTQADQDAVPEHLAMLPFARNLFDPMDFTPVVFGDIPGVRRATRNGFELALSVVLLSGVQHYADTPEGLATAPAEVREFLRTLPRQWDEVRFLAGEPGRFVALARRAGTRWYVAAINGSDTERTVDVDLGFLAGRTGALIGEGDGPRDFRMGSLEGGAVRRLTLPAHGGAVATFPAAGP